MARVFTVAADLNVSVGRAAPVVGKPSANIKKRKTFALPEGAIALPTRSCPPALSQLLFLRASMTDLLDVQNPGGKAGLLRDKDLPQEYVCG